jgi:YD repeat-containing protein
MSEAGRLARFIGTFSWQPPHWMHHSLTRRLSLLVVLFAVVWVAWRLVLPLFPQPGTWMVEVLPPEATPEVPHNSWRIAPNLPALRVVFRRDGSEDGKNDNGPARIDLVHSEVTEGIRLSPQLAGNWHWQDEYTLVFVPEGDWPAGQRYEIEFGAQPFAPDARIARDRRTTLTLPNGSLTTYSYDAVGQVTEIQYSSSSSTVGNLTYTYDAAGRPIGMGGSLARQSAGSTGKREL